MRTETMKIVPLGCRVLVRPEPSAEKSKGGILLPDNAKKRPQLGQVIAVGPGKADGVAIRPVNVKVGQKILFQQYAGRDVKELSEDLLMDEDDILAVVEG